jgi:Family of unknown function (DUF6152)
VKLATTAGRRSQEGHARTRVTRPPRFLVVLGLAGVFVGVFLGVFVASPPMRSAWAHHSFAMYDQTKLIVITGTVKEFQWSNPHALVWLIKDPPTGSKSVPSGGGAAPTSEDLWSIELPTSPGVLRKLGWTKHSLGAGDRVAIEINPLRSGEHGGSFKKVTNLETGEVLTAITSAPSGAGGAAGAGGGSGTASPYAAPPAAKAQP